MMNFRQLLITPILNGFIIKAGCSHVVVEGGHEVLLKKLRRYYEKPRETEIEYQKNSIDAHVIPDKEPERADADVETRDSGEPTVDDALNY